MRSRIWRSPFRQLELDAAVAFIGVLGGAGVDRLEFAKAGGDQPLRRDALATRYCTTAMARAADNSQFDLNCPPVIGRTSVWPSTRSTQAISAGICFSRPVSAPATLSSSGSRPAADRPCRCRRTVRDCSTKRSPTMRTSGRLPRISRSLPKKSERYSVSSCTFCASARLSRWPRSAICSAPPCPSSRRHRARSR